MTKVVAVVAGEAFGAYLDLRSESPTRGVVETVALVPGVQVLVPSGVANGFQALVDGTQYVYCFDKEWRPRCRSDVPVIHWTRSYRSTGRCRSILTIGRRCRRRTSPPRWSPSWLLETP